jgi:hypothetical protein
MISDQANAGIRGALAIGRTAVGELVLWWRRAKPVQPTALIVGELTVARFGWRQIGR